MGIQMGIQMGMQMGMQMGIQMGMQMGMQTTQVYVLELMDWILQIITAKQITQMFLKKMTVMLIFSVNGVKVFKIKIIQSSIFKMIY